MTDIVIRIIDGEAWRKLTPEETFQFLGKKVEEPKAVKPKGRVYTKAMREAQAKRMRAYWKEKKSKKA